jgi:ABC-type uncharacterized transport system permease subunit
LAEIVEAPKVAARSRLPGPGALLAGQIRYQAGVLVYHTELTPGGAASLLLTLAMAALAFTYFPVMLLSGVLGGLGGLPPWLATVLRYLPGQPTVDATTRALQAGGSVPVPVHDLAVLGAWALAALLISLRAFRWEPRAAR